MYITRTNGIVDFVKCEIVANKIVEFIKTLTTRGVLGVSGGADSTLMACLCVKALGADKLYTYSLPYNDVDASTFNDRSSKLTKYLGCNHQTVPICSIVDSVMSLICEDGVDTSHWLINGNARARARMIVLYAKCSAIANTTGDITRVMGTDNKNEHYIGYFTVYGDGGVDNNPIEDLYKQEIYDILDYFVHIGMILDDHIDRVPSAGLMDGHTDEGEIGYTYHEMSMAIEYLTVCNDDESILAIRDCAIYYDVWKRHIKTNYKREMPLMLSLRN